MSIAERSATPTVPRHGVSDRSPPGASVWPRALTDRTGCDARFRRATDRGNRTYAAGDLDGARPHYDEALAEARALFQVARARGGAAALVAPMMLNIACQNLAALEHAQGDGVSARALTVAAIEDLIAAAASPACPIAMRINCVRHLGYALDGLGAPDDPPTAVDAANATLVERAMTTANEVVRIATLLSRPQAEVPELGLGGVEMRPIGIATN